MLLKYEASQAERSEAAKLCEDYWFYLGVNSQIITNFQEVRKGVTRINDKAHSCIEQMDFQV